MKFSVVIAVYNCEKYLSQCLESILSQEFADYEVVLVDDGSNDNSPQICDDYAKRYSQIKVVHTENKGPLSARKTGIENASGEYIITVDSDDCVSNDFFEYLYNQIIKHNNPDGVFFGCTYVDDSLQKIIKVQKNNFTPKLYFGDEIKEIEKALLHDENEKGINFGALLFSLCTKVVKRDILYKAMCNCEPSIRYGEDLIVSKFIFRYLESNKILISDYCGYLYRQNSTSLINSACVSKIKEYAKTVDCLESCFDKEKNKISVFSFRVLTGVFYTIAKLSNSFFEYKREIKKTKTHKKIYRYASSIKISKKSMKDYFKILVVNKNILILSYIYFKYFLRGND